MDYLEGLQQLSRCHGPSGDEGEIAAFLEKLAAPFCDKCWTDPLGNLIAHREGTGKRIMFTAHMIGFKQPFHFGNDVTAAILTG